MLDVVVIIGNNLHNGSVVANAHLDITVIIGDVEKSFKIIRGDISFLIELVDRLFIILCHVVLLVGCIGQV